MGKLEALLADESARAAEFPICRRKAYFAHAAIAPMPPRVVAAMTAYLEASSRDVRDIEGIFAHAVRTRERAAKLIGAGPDEVALIGPTSLGLNVIAQGVEWKEGDEVFREDLKFRQQFELQRFGQRGHLRGAQFVEDDLEHRCSQIHAPDSAAKERRRPDRRTIRRRFVNRRSLMR